MDFDTCDMRDKRSYNRTLNLLELPLTILCAFCFTLLVLGGCKKTDNFYKTLSTLPQIDNNYGYKAAYSVGDTLVIRGVFNPIRNVGVSVGGINAPVVKTDSVSGVNIVVNGQTISKYEQIISVIITQAMVGSKREVKISNGGYSALGAPIEVYTVGGPGSFNRPLSPVQVAALPEQCQFLYAITGKGDAFYYTQPSKSIWRVGGDGAITKVLDISGLNISSFVAGGVDASERYLFFSVQTTAGYALYRQDMTQGDLILLNRSASTVSPYEGSIANVHMIVTRIYPDMNGNAYLGVGGQDLLATTYFHPDAIARYAIADGTVHYLYKSLDGFAPYAGMPGLDLGSVNVVDVKIMPDEQIMYAIRQNSLTSSYGIQQYSLQTSILLQDIEPFTADLGGITHQSVVAPFTQLRFLLSASGTSLQGGGFLPMPGNRLMVLYNHFDHLWWLGFDFASKRTYAYAPGDFQLTASGQYAIDIADQLLNYDQDGNLFMTANKLSYFLKTQLQ